MCRTWKWNDNRRKRWNKKVVYDKITRINRVFISPPNCRATPEVVQAIKEADCIVIGQEVYIQM